MLAMNAATAEPKPHRKAHAAAAARAQIMPAPRPAVDPYAVYVGGTYAGRDPDPNIRAQLIREFGKRR
jgi:hypothetical protein